MGLRITLRLRAVALARGPTRFDSVRFPTPTLYFVLFHFYSILFGFDRGELPNGAPTGLVGLAVAVST